MLRPAGFDEDPWVDPLVDPPAALPPPARRLAGLATTESGLRRLWAAVVVLLLLGLASCMRAGAGHPRDPYLVDQQVPSGIGSFGKIAFRVERLTSEGTAVGPDFCALLARTEAERNQGLMGRRDLAGYAGMVFVFDQDTTTPFYMRNTPVPLSIAFFDKAGRFVSSTDMAPCPDKDGCPLYQAAGPYRVALEVARGGLTPIGIGHGAGLSIGGTCTPAG